MSLAGINPGDIVRAGIHHGEVRVRERGRLLVRWLGNGTSERWIKAREVEAHWRRTKK
jgi:hypothetical protein